MSENELVNAVKAQISQANELTEAAYYLPLVAKRVLWMCLKETYRRKEDSDQLSPAFTLRVSDYENLFSVNNHQASRDLKNGINELEKHKVTLFPKDGDYEQLTLAWLTMTGKKRNRGEWDIWINDMLMPFMVGLTSKFTTYSLLDCAKLRNPRTIRLYESLCQFRSSGIWVTSAKYLSDRYQLPETQRTNSAELRRGFLNPALKNIAENTPIKAKAEFTRDGKIIFTIISGKQD